MIPMIPLRKLCGHEQQVVPCDRVLAMGTVIHGFISPNRVVRYPSNLNRGATSNILYLMRKSFWLTLARREPPSRFDDDDASMKPWLAF
ncbi:hypothetical protein DY000_02046910 [Brassica cretica]|uniref:Uncharacterized protein n=1 Tax=Brassica cretica TaxID=69181 RepID=A0ABQ7F2D6_BRACR|nr:hypothetical protein DY000_02046910 [Brassica cretica]